MESPSPDSAEHKAEALESLVSNSLVSLASRLLTRFRGIPSGKDFHFYNNFDEFKLPAREIAFKTQSSLGNIASSTSLWEKKNAQPLPEDLDEAYEWLVNLNDDFLDKFGVSMDEFKSIREKQELNDESVDLANGFQLVCGKKKRRGIVQNHDNDEGISASLEIKMVSRDRRSTAPRAKVPFHIPSIPKPQNEFSIIVNNKNTPFEHVWLERSEDKSRFIHPLEKFSVADFIDRNIIEDKIKKPLSLDATPFKIVENVKDLKDLAAKLCGVDEFAVDLEHNQYRSFLGLTCLMQISTRTEDFVVDTLKLRVHIGPYLRGVFKDPLKRKVMHGADCDVLWLQRDFGIYVCNLFDTGQGSRVLQLERKSLEYLLRHYCNVEANKEYQNADWRLRPLPDEMIKYAREDTHYLLHIYDLMRYHLLSSYSDGSDLLFEVYKRSSIVCLKFYEKELLTDTSYLHIYGLFDADFNAKQLAIVSGLCEWRDKIAREEDESTGYILPNKAVLEIARQMPRSFGNLCRLVKSKHQYVECHLSEVMKIIKNAIANSSSFEVTVEEIRKKQIEALALQNLETQNLEHNTDHAVTKMDDKSSISHLHGKIQENDKRPGLSLLENNCSSSICDAVGTVKKELMDNGATTQFQLAKEVTPMTSVQVIKKPACAFGSLFGNSSRKKTNPFLMNDFEQNKNENKVAQIKASMVFPFYSFSKEESSPITSPAKNSTATFQSSAQLESEPSLVEQVISFGISTDGSDVDCSNSKGDSPKLDADMTNTSMSLSDLSSGFQQCFQSIGLRKSQVNISRSEQSELSPQLSPFDYTMARKTMKFGEVDKAGREKEEVSTTDKPPTTSNDAKEGHCDGGRQPRRRQAFPFSGNRCTTYRDSKC